MIWEDLTAPEFARGVKKARGVCVIPLGVIEKHGTHLPLGTDVFRGRHVAIEAAKREPAIVFPFYPFGQILEGKHQPGTIAIGGDMMMDLLFEVCAEISRNGMKKIVLLNAHGGNNNFLQFFCQLALETERDYHLYLPQGHGRDPDIDGKLKKLLKDPDEEHAGETETSAIMVIRPDTVKLSADIAPHGKRQPGLSYLPGVFSGVTWYSQFPHHYAGMAKLGTREKGKLLLEKDIRYIAGVIAAVRKDTAQGRHSREFFKKARRPFRST